MASYASISICAVFCGASLLDSQKYTFELGGGLVLPLKFPHPSIKSTMKCSLFFEEITCFYQNIQPVTTLFVVFFVVGVFHSRGYTEIRVWH